jgi:hypothetical protein
MGKAILVNFHIHIPSLKPWAVMENVSSIFIIALPHISRFPLFPSNYLF